MGSYFLKEVTVVWVLHDNAKKKEKWEIFKIRNLPEAAAGFVDERLLVRNNILMPYTSQDSNFIKSIFLLFVRKLFHLDLLQSVNFIICIAANLVDWAVSALS